MMPTMEDDMLGMGNSIKPNMDIYINIEYTVPLSVGTSKIPASPKAMTIPILTSKGMTIHNDAVDFFFIKSPQNRRCATFTIAHLGSVFKGAACVPPLVLCIIRIFPE